MPAPSTQTASRPRRRSWWWRLHSVLGLSVGALILLMSVTGSVLVMHADIERAWFPERHLVSSVGGNRAAVAPVLAQLATDAPAGYRPLRIELGKSRNATDKYLFVAPDGRTRWAAYVNPYTGFIQWQGDDQALFTSWLLHLHMHLRVGGWGYVITGVAGAGLFLLGVTGLVVHRRHLRTLWRAPMRLDRGVRAAASDFHKWVGIASIYFSLVLGLTGTIYAIKIAPGQIAAPKPLPAPFDFTRLTPITPVLAAAAREFPEAEIIRVAFPTGQKAPLTVLALHRDAPVWRKFSRVELDPVTGVTRAVRDGRLATPAEKFSALLAPLHFGFYGAPWVKWLYVLGGFSPAFLAATGTTMWLLRRRRARSREESSSPAAVALPEPQ